MVGLCVCFTTKLFLKVVVPSSYVTQQSVTVRVCSTSSPALGMISLTSFIHFNGHIMLFHCGFSLYTPNQ